MGKNLACSRIAGVVKDNPELCIIVHESGCPACRALLRSLERLEVQGAYYLVNIDECEGALEAVYDRVVTSVPTVVRFRNGKMVARAEGVEQAQALLTGGALTKGQDRHAGPRAHRGEGKP